MVEKLIQRITRSSVHTGFFHFTDTRNLPSIREHGLVSKAWAAENSLNLEFPGGNDHSHEADSYKGLDDYVNLCFWHQHPMEFRAREDGRIVESKFLKISPEILRIEGVMLTLDVANKKDVPLLIPSDDLEGFDVEVLYNRTNWNDPDVQARLKVVEKYELLVPRRVELKYIIGGL